MKNIAVFASGNGSNAQNIVEWFAYKSTARVSRILTNNPGAGVIERAKQSMVPFTVFNREEWKNTNCIDEILKKDETDFIVLAGFLWLVPSRIIQQYPDKIVNIHPALLPKYGGKGMFGDNVHQKVIEMKEEESGITIHYVNEHYDEGSIIFQATCPVLPEDTTETLASRIHILEHKHYPEEIEKLLLR
ncbi:MAG: phosphoribosylglycinamide formyltransferase [Bacteroidota bacterium]